MLGRVRDPAVAELSGLTRGRRAPGVLFAVEDSGAAPALLALRQDGTVRERAVLPGVANTDWEDVAAGRGPDGRAVILVADIGDNASVRDRVQIHRVPEPDPGATSTPAPVSRSLRYPDGPHDAETLLADPLRRGDVVVVTKTVAGGRAYTAPAGDGDATLRRGPAVRIGPVTAGDVSADGRIVALRSYASLVVWERRGREPLARTLGRPPACTAPADLLAEGQGEALALDRRGTTAVTAPEGPQPLLRRYGTPGGPARAR